MFVILAKYVFVLNRGAEIQLMCFSPCCLSNPVKKAAEFKDPAAFDFETLNQLALLLTISNNAFYYARISKRGYVAQLINRAFADLTQNPPHNFA